MGLRFGKSFNLGGGVRLNLSRRGVGVSAGVKGFRVSVGPRGTRVSASIPGTGIGWSQQLGSGRAAVAPPAAPSQLPNPGIFAPALEKDYVKGVNEHLTGQVEAALPFLLRVASEEPSAAVLAAVILNQQAKPNLAVRILESVLRRDCQFPTPLMQKYGISLSIQIAVTPSARAVVPLDGFAATLSLVELYQAQGAVDQAIGLLEEVEEIAEEPVVTLSLCDLYAARGLWEGIIDRAQGIKPEDDVTLEIAILYGRALMQKRLYEAAVTVFSGALRKKKGRSQDLLNEGAYWRACCYEALGKKAQANREFQKVYAYAPELRDVAQRVQAFVPAG